MLAPTSKILKPATFYKKIGASDAKLAPTWWGMVDSNHRRHCQQIYSLSPLATREFPHIRLLHEKLYGAGRRTRTPDLLITNQLLYQLSYTSTIPACI